MRSVNFGNSEARGRNGWFRMAQATLHTSRDRVHVNIVSKRAVAPGPVYLELSLEDAAALGIELIRQARGEDERPRKALRKADH